MNLLSACLGGLMLTPPVAPLPPAPPAATTVPPAPAWLVALPPVGPVLPASLFVIPPIFAGAAELELQAGVEAAMSRLAVRRSVGTDTEKRRSKQASKVATGGEFRRPNRGFSSGTRRANSTHPRLCGANLARSLRRGSVLCFPHHDGPQSLDRTSNGSKWCRLRDERRARPRRPDDGP